VRASEKKLYDFLSVKHGKEELLVFVVVVVVVVVSFSRASSSSHVVLRFKNVMSEF
jgi:hypothetical protein